jgi:hypothetical protein
LAPQQHTGGRRHRGAGSTDSNGPHGERLCGMLYQNLAINNPLRNSAKSGGNALARRGRSDPIGDVGGCLVIVGVVMVIS